MIHFECVWCHCKPHFTNPIGRIIDFSFYYHHFVVFFARSLSLSPLFISLNIQICHKFQHKIGFIFSVVNKLMDFFLFSFSKNLLAILNSHTILHTKSTFRMWFDKFLYLSLLLLYLRLHIVHMQQKVLLFFFASVKFLNSSLNKAMTFN